MADTESVDHGNSGETSDNWVTNIQDEGIRGWAESKGFQDTTPENALKSYRSLEQVFGADKSGHTVKLLGQNSSEEEISSFYTKLGRPDEATNYGFNAPEGQAPEFANAAKDKFFELGLSDKQAMGLSDWWNDQSSNMTQQTETQYNDSVAKDMEDLKAEWGAAYDQNVGLAKSAAAKFGFTTEEIDALEEAKGFKTIMSSMHKLAVGTGQDTIEGNKDNVSGNVMAPAQAQVELDRLMMDKSNQDAMFNKMHPLHNDFMLRKERLAKMVAGVA